jgi:hypothetical protein
MNHQAIEDTKKGEDDYLQMTQMRGSRALAAQRTAAGAGPRADESGEFIHPPLSASICVICG